MKKDRRVIDSYETEYLGQKVTIKVGKPKEKRKQINRPKNVTTCPECSSTLILNNIGVWQCTGDQLKQWENQFYKYSKLNEDDKVEFLKSVSDTGKFQYLFGRWEYSQESDSQGFNCGYSNNINLPLPNSQSKLPDPLFVKHVERKLGRPLTEEEKWGEGDIWFYKGQYLNKYRKNSKRVKIPIISIPRDVINKAGI